MLNAIIHWSLGHRLAVLAGAAAILAFGTYESISAPIDVFPQFAPPQVVIQTEAPGYAPLQVEQQVTRPLEYALLGLGSVQDVRSSSITGLSVITVIFNEDSNIWTDRQLVGEALGVVSVLPPRVNRPRLAPVTSPIGIIEVIGITSTQPHDSTIPGANDDMRSDQDPCLARTLADWVIRPRLLAVPGVANVTIYGGLEKQYQVVISPSQLRNYNLSLEQVMSATAQSNAQGTGGFFTTPGQQLVIHTSGQIADLDQLRKSTVAIRNGTPIKLGEIGEVRFGASPAIGGASINGGPGLILQVMKQPWADTVATTRAVDSALSDLAPTLPHNVEIHPGLFKQADFIQSTTLELKTAILEGGLLVAIILFVFMRSVRSASISLIAIPLSLLTAVLILVRSGASLNSMTLGGLVLALGEVVDDAIIDVENISRRLRENRSRTDPLPIWRVVYLASTEVRDSVVYATFIVALVFLPIFFLSGVEGRIFTPLAEAYILSTLASLLVALTVTPVLSFWLLPQVAHAGDNRLVSTVKRAYEKLISRTLSHARVIGIASLVASAIALATVPFMGGEFLPALNEDNAVLHMVGLPGLSLEQVLLSGQHLERALLRVPEITSVDQRAGRAELGEDTNDLNYSELDVRFKAGRRPKAQVIADLRRVTDGFPGFVWSTNQYISERMDEVLSGSTSDVVMKVFGPDLEVLDRISAEIQQVAAEVPGVADLQRVEQTETPQLDIRFDREAAQAYGLTSDQVASAVQTAFLGTSVGTVLEDQMSFDLVVKFPDRQKADLQTIKDTLIDAGNAKVPLREIAQVNIAPAPSAIARENGTRVMVVQSNVENRDLVGFVTDLRSRLQRSVSLPTGYRLEFGGQFESRARAARLIELLGIAALGGIVLLLYSAFSSFRDTFLVLFNVPMAFVGGVAAVLLSGANVSIATLIGFITLFGITTRNGIMLITHYQHLQREEGEQFNAGMVLRGASERLLPILMTALATGLALLPVAVTPNRPGRELEQPMAIVILGGLVTSTILNLLVMPTLFLRYGRRAGVGARTLDER